MSRINKTQYAILGALSVHSMSGYDLKKWIIDVTGSFWSESPGQVHPTLRQLMKEKLIICDDSKGVGKRPKKIYSITKKGLKFLHDWLVLPVEKMVFRDEFILKLFYGQNLSKEETIFHLQQQKKAMEGNLERYDKIIKHLKEEHAKDKGAVYWLMTLENTIKHAETEVLWCDRSMINFKKNK